MRTTVPQPQWGEARWIGAPWSTVRDGAEADGSKPMPIFRREFVLRGKPAKATLRIVGLGQWSASLAHAGEVHVVGGKGLHGAWTDYRKRVEFESVDVASLLARGPNVLAVMLGNGMYNVQRSPLAKGARYTKFEGSFGAPKLIGELTVQYADGSTQVVGSDARWKVARGPVVFDSTYGGEDYDARREPRGWEGPGFDDTAWEAAQVVDAPGGALVPALAPNVGQHELYRPVKQTDLGGGRVVYDLGRNFAGIVHVRVQGPAGAVLKLTPGELLKPDGTVSQGSSGGPMWWSYGIRGDARGEDWEPLFGYYGFRYVQAEWVGSGNSAASGTVLRLAGIAEHTDSAVVGSFQSSNEMLNGIHRLITTAMLNNSMSLFTDCPHREKLGWLEEDHLQAAGLMFNSDVEALYRETDRLIADAQDASGKVPTMAPQYTKFGPKYAVYDDSPEWGSAAVLAPWAAYRFYGDKAELAQSYATMQGWVRYLQSRTKENGDGVVSYGLGDWYDIGPKPPGFSQDTTAGVTGTLMLVECAQAMQRIAVVLGKPEDAAMYAEVEQKAAGAFEARFWDAAHGWYDTGSQTANAMPLALGIVPEARRATVLAHVVEDIEVHADHVTTGEIGYPYLLRALMGAGRNDVVMRLMMRRDAPSYGAQLAAGATALTEAWDANPKSSQDHFMLGGGEEWFYRALGGMDMDLSRGESAARITVRPVVVDGVDWVRCGYLSKLGKVESDWKRVGAGVQFAVTVPVDATVVLPGRVSGAPAGVRATGRDTFRVKAGHYVFRVTM